MVGIRHATKAPYDKVYAIADWNANHVVDDLSITLSKLVQSVQDLINGALQENGVSGVITCLVPVYVCGDIEFDDVGQGLVLTDRVTLLKRRILSTNGVLSTEAV